jgi:hypothetical protein
MVYWCIDCQLSVSIAAALVRVLAAIGGDARAQGLLSAIERRFVLSGWPHHAHGWVNLHVSRFVARVRRFGRAASAVSAAPIGAHMPIRFGCVGRFRGLLSFPRELFDAFPREAQLHLFDIEFNGGTADYLAGVASQYVALKGLGAIDAAAQAINGARLDVLLSANSKADAYDLLDRVDTPCVLNFCGGSDLLHHQRVSFNLHGQPQADYFVAGRRMFCGTTGRYFEPARVYSVRGYYDPRGLTLSPPKPWPARRPLMVFHGSLIKLAHDDVLHCLCAVLADDASVDFVIMGKDSGGALARIRRAAAGYHVAARVHYEGAFDSSRSGGGAVADPGWARLCEFLSDARLAPDPWPVGGGSSRFEAFAMGAPSVHMGVRFDAESWGRSQPSVVEVPHMMVREATAWNVAEYRALCGRCLGDESFATDVMEKQLQIARELADPTRLWPQVFAAYGEWLAANQISADHVAALAAGETLHS